MKKINLMLGILVISLIMASCKKKEVVNSSSYPYSIRLTDAPGPFNAVFIDLQGIEITGNNGQAIQFNVIPGIYNLLNYSNGVDVLIATGNLEISEVQQIRLILGPNNTVMIDSVIYPLSTPSAEQSGLKLQVHQTLQAGVMYSVLLDFDANKSIVQEGNGTYKLKPVIRTIETAISGAIKGKITPIGALAFVTATDGTSYSTNVSATGDFILMGLPSGNYSVTITPAFPFSAVTQTNIFVYTGVTTNMGTINF